MSRGIGAMKRSAATTVAAALLAAGFMVVQGGPDGRGEAERTAEPVSPAKASPSPTPRLTSSASPTPDAAPVQPSASPVLAVLEQLPVKGRAPKTGYDREQFGPAWPDVNGNGCDTRNDILARDLTETTVDFDGCTVLSGLLADPYSRTWIPFTRGVDTSDLVQIDHVVSLSDAWQKGAQQLTAAQRERFANDPLNLLAVDGGLNQQKSDGDAATWLPPNRAFRCEMVSRQVAVKDRYDLWVTQAEKDAIARVLSSCPDQRLPTAGGPVGVVPQGPAPAAGGSASAVDPAPTQPGDLVFANCTEARQAGAAPLRRGESGYRPALDRDGDGVACE